ncbi:hypothetical protein Aple_024950 [Acrocarpospora pleiomorpha]|uniref:Short-chain dehydrogenase n=1 Tax=Acrocarpospora pleiomorpha TaxID=90975 RepID=A0A5M3XHC2_9ACTN|nr:SDR family NAD(P)-dependent oxidoreductase [Acrocarpospora pleiomorpha]GES19599.1 hypothetical protein Aple_024950 [Acrocarpospora pleiomorpha]
MSVIAIVGAGPGLGVEIARAFGKKGFTVAMVARNAAKLDALAAGLRAEGIEAAGFRGDIGEPDTITEAFTLIKERYGAIDVLEFSPADPTLGGAGVLNVDPANLQPQIDFYLNGAIHTVRQVAADMIAAKSGTILITTGGGSITPVPALANINIAATGLRNWTLNLHNELKPHNISDQGLLRPGHTPFLVHVADRRRLPGAPDRPRRHPARPQPHPRPRRPDPHLPHRRLRRHRHRRRHRTDQRPGLDRSGRASWSYLFTVSYLNRRRILPRNLMAFLDDAHRLGLLRAVGPIYQFRHADLQDHLADQPT